MADKIFPKGIMAFAPHSNAPAFIKASVVINVKELQDWLNGAAGQNVITEHPKYGDQIKLQITEGREGKYSIQVDTYKKS